MNIDDPRFTAYALGESDGLSESECAELEQLLAEDDEARGAFEEIQNVSGTLASAFRGEPEVDLTPEQKDAIAAASSLNAIPEPARVIAFPLKSILAVAACATLGLMVAGVYFKRSATDPVALAEDPKGVLDAPVHDGSGGRSEIRDQSDRANESDQGVGSNGSGRSDGRDGSVAVREEEREAVVTGSGAGGVVGGEYAEPQAQPSLVNQLVIADEPAAGKLGFFDKASGALFVADENEFLGSELDANRNVPMQAAETSGSQDAQVLVAARTAVPSASEPTDASIHGSGEIVELQEYVGGPRPHRAMGRAIGGAGRSHKRDRATSETYAMASAAAPSAARESQTSASNADTMIYPPPHPPEHPRHPYPWPKPPPSPIYRDRDTEDYDAIEDNPFYWAEQNPLSTLSIDVDTASYANVRRFLNGDRLPPADAVRIEELVNYFPYNYAGPEADDEHPFTAHVEVASAPWQAEHRLVRIALKGRNVDWKKRPPSNLVFLIDVSGSMRAQNKLPLVQASLQMLARRFDERDRIAIITYAGESRVALPSTTANNTETVLHAIKGLTAGGSTHASAGIEEAYAIARKHLIKGSTNRVILCTDGDFNVGVTNRGDLVRLITGSAQKGITLSVLGFGMGNYKDGTLEELSNKGDGNYGYIDTQREARKVFVEQVSGTLMTIAKDVKIQVEFNPTQVRAYRLLGYENRKLAAQDFNDDTKDAGEIGAGHTVTAFYEVIPMGVEYQGPGVDPLKYQKPAGPMRAKYSAELLTVKLRYKTPEIDSSVLMEIPVVDDGAIFHDASEDFRFAAGVAAFGMILRDSPYRGESSFTEVRSIAEQAQGNNMGGYRSEFLYLVDRAEMIGEERDPEPVRPMPMPEEPPHIMPMPR